MNLTAADCKASGASDQFCGSAWRWRRCEDKSLFYSEHCIRSLGRPVTFTAAMLHMHFIQR